MMQKTKMIADTKAMQGVKNCGWEYIIATPLGRMDTKHRDLRNAENRMKYLDGVALKYNRENLMKIHKLDDLINQPVADDDEDEEDLVKVIFGDF